jgi:hypothetical protein
MQGRHIPDGRLAHKGTLIAAVARAIRRRPMSVQDLLALPSLRECSEAYVRIMLHTLAKRADREGVVFRKYKKQGEPMRYFLGVR